MRIKDPLAKAVILIANFTLFLVFSTILWKYKHSFVDLVMQ